ncbi:hypothetical protein [Cohnella cellulosilytica]|uniref:Uncharacterized protein n=1 Tax=Cohnella cellulosilytica TaxID=986710 RepID=A0ABW2FBB2_9BACL
MWSVEEFCAAYGVDRRNSDSVKWDRVEERFGAGGLLPMWVADMDFKIPEAAQKAMIDRVLHGAFGYGGIPASYYEALFGWMSTRHGVELDQS